MRPSGMPRRMKTAQEALRDRLFAGFLARAYRSQARDGMRLLSRAPMADCGTRMDPNKGHGENIRTNNWREKGRRIVMGHATCLRRRSKTTKYPEGISTGGVGAHFRIRRSTKYFIPS